MMVRCPMCRFRKVLAVVAGALVVSPPSFGQVSPQTWSGPPQQVIPLFPEVGAPTFTTPVGSPTNGAGSNNNDGSGETGPTSGATAVSGSGNILTYTNADGSTTTLTGGSVAWRNNNPGNLRSGDSSIGTNNGFAVFPDLASGNSALNSLLQTPVYQALSVNAAIARYAPASENDTSSYQTTVANSLGVSGTTPLSSLSTAQMQTLQGAIRKVEGYNPGTISHS